MMKKVVCNNCNGYGFISKWGSGDDWGHAWSERCPECGGTGAINVPMTNADRIRCMSDEEIANVLLDWFCVGNRECFTRNRAEVYNEILHWMQSQPLV